MSVLARRHAIGKRIRREELRKAIVLPADLSIRGIAGEWKVVSSTDFPAVRLAVGPWVASTAFTATADASLDGNDVVIATAGIWRIALTGTANVELYNQEEDNRSGARLMVNGAQVEEAFTPVSDIRLTPPPRQLAIGDRISADLVPSLGDVLPADFTLFSADLTIEAVLMTELR